MMREHGMQSFELEGPYSVISGLPCVGDHNIIGITKSRLKEIAHYAPRVRVTVEVLDDDDRYAEIHRRIRGR